MGMGAVEEGKGEGTRAACLFCSLLSRKELAKNNKQFLRCCGVEVATTGYPNYEADFRALWLCDGLVTQRWWWW